MTKEYVLHMLETLKNKRKMDIRLILKGASQLSDDQTVLEAIKNTIKYLVQEGRLTASTAEQYIREFLPALIQKSVETSAGSVNRFRVMMSSTLMGENWMKRYSEATEGERAVLMQEYLKVEEAHHTLLQAHERIPSNSSNSVSNNKVQRSS